MAELVDAAADPRSLLTEEMRAAVGREYAHRVSFPVAASDIRKWALAIYYPELPPRLFWDEAYAATTRFGGVVAPEDFNPFAWMAASPQPDVSPRSEVYPEPWLGLPLPPTRANIISGLEVDYTATRMWPGDIISATNAIKSYTEREGRLGLMLITTTEEQWRNQRDELVRTSRTILIRYR